MSYKRELIFSPQAHREQLNHVTRGCLARTSQDVSSDGSRIEGSHKGWNSLQRSFASGIENWLAMAADFTLRRNIRVIRARPSHLQSDFVTSTFGCHHVGLINTIAPLWNVLIHKFPDMHRLPELQLVNSSEDFGLVHSAHAATFGGLFSIKDEDENDEDEDELYALGIFDKHSASEDDSLPLTKTNVEEASSCIVS